MRNVFIITIFSFFASSLYCQSNDIPEDTQWYITESWYRSSLEYEPVNNLNFSSFSINLEPHPEKDLADPENPHIKFDGRNDILIIFQDGSYRNTYVHPIDDGEKPGIGYNIVTPNGLQPLYMYLTNSYEDDDPESYLSIGLDNSISEVTNLNNLTTTDIISVNHDIVKNKDLTVIITLPNKEERIINGPYTLCFNQVIDENGNLVDLTDMNFEESKVFDGDYIYNGNGILSNNCIEEFTLIDSEKSAFINLRVPEEIGIHRDRELKFVLLNTDIIAGHEETIRDSHDPNFIEVKKIICTKGKEKALFRIECKNTGKQPAKLKFKMQLPRNCRLPIVVESWGINEDSYSIEEIGFEKLLNNGKLDLEFKFDDSDKIEIGRSAFVEFWCNIYTNNQVWNEEKRRKHLRYVQLQPKWPHTLFDNDKYAITNFYDPAVLNTDLSHTNKSNHLKLNMSYGTHRHICYGFFIDNRNLILITSFVIILILLLALILKKRKQP